MGEFRDLVVEDKQPQLNRLAERRVGRSRRVLECSVRSKESRLPVFLGVITTKKLVRNKQWSPSG